MIQKMNFTDHVHIERLELQAHIGVCNDERASAQRLICNLTFWPVRSMETLEDEIGRAVDYATVCAETVTFVQHRSDKLLETLANALAVHLLMKFEVAQIKVELRKFVLPETAFVSVTVMRERDSVE